ncbi:transposase [Rhizobium lusitanum]|nr:transposase [Rhizobium lusitanum]
MHDDSEYQRLELITGRRKRRNWSDEEKIEILAASNETGANISEVARRFGVSRGLMGIWRKNAGLTVAGSLPRSTGNAFVPIVVEQGSTLPGSEARGSGGRIEITVDGACAIIDGSVPPSLASAVIFALRGRR